MSEPISSTAVGIFGWKAIGGLAGVGGAGAGLAAYIVMTMTKPKSDEEWHLSLVSTLIGSFCGGPAMVMYLGIKDWINEPFGLMGIVGICFACGLPSWLIVRSLFAWMEKRRNADFAELLHDAHEAAKEVL